MGLSEEQEKELLKSMRTTLADLIRKNADRHDLAEWFIGPLGSMEEVAKGTEAGVLGVLLGNLVVEYSRARLITAGQERELVKSMLATIQTFLPNLPPDFMEELNEMLYELMERDKPTTARALGKVLGQAVSAATGFGP